MRERMSRSILAVLLLATCGHRYALAESKPAPAAPAPAQPTKASREDALQFRAAWAELNNLSQEQERRLDEIRAIATRYGMDMMLLQQAGAQCINQQTLQVLCKPRPAAASAPAKAEPAKPEAKAVKK